MSNRRADTMNGEAVFILSDQRSGSTLLDQLLGAHPDVVSLGEVHWLAAYVRQDRTIYDPAHPLICSCGEAVGECAFWREVGRAAGQPLDSLRHRLKWFSWNAYEQKGMRARLSRIPVRVIKQSPGLFRYYPVQRIFAGRQLAKDSIKLFDAIFEVSGSRYLVDSSKLPFRFRAIYDLAPERVRTILLARDFRAVVHSKMKRGLSLRESAISWRKRIEQMEILTADVPAGRRYRLKYEDLCVDPRGELTRLCEFLSIEFSEKMLQRPKSEIHHIGGSPSKFDHSKTAISLDTSYQAEFTQEASQELRHLVGDAAEIWGYGIDNRPSA